MPKVATKCLLLTSGQVLAQYALLQASCQAQNVQVQHSTKQRRRHRHLIRMSKKLRDESESSGAWALMERMRGLSYSAALRGAAKLREGLRVGPDTPHKFSATYRSNPPTNRYNRELLKPCQDVAASVRCFPSLRYPSDHGLVAAVLRLKL